jgi:hypothetical protein
VADATMMHWGDVSYPIIAGHLDGPRFSMEAVVGTGFVPCDGVVVTCWHCVRDSRDELDYVVGLRPPEGQPVDLKQIRDLEKDDRGFDLATGSVELEASPRFNLCPAATSLVGQSVWSVGFPMPRRTVSSSGRGLVVLQPRCLRGYITTEHDSDSDDTFTKGQPTFELDMLAPAGMSGAPLLIQSIGPVGLRLVGVVYGSMDSYTIADEALVDSESGERRAEVRRYVSFGAAHSLVSIHELRGRATGGRTLAELMSDSPRFELSS